MIATRPLTVLAALLLAIVSSVAGTKSELRRPVGESETQLSHHITTGDDSATTSSGNTSEISPAENDNANLLASVAPFSLRESDTLNLLPVSKVNLAETFPAAISRPEYRPDSAGSFMFREPLPVVLPLSSTRPSLDRSQLTLPQLARNFGAPSRRMFARSITLPECLSTESVRTPVEKQIVGLGLWPESIAPLSTNPLRELIELEQRIARFRPHVQPAIVSVEGGSGFIASPGGIVITVAHVTRNAGRKVVVQLSDGTKVNGTTLGSNNSTDLGAIQLDGPGPWPSLEMGDPASLQPGDWCISMGYPITFARDQPPAIRTGRVLTTTENQITTDCIIMGGDSGGPLLDGDGRVIGINVGVTTDVNKNIHMPVDRFIDDTKTILAGIDLRNSGGAGQTWLGVRGETDSSIVRIRSVNSGSPAEKAGLKTDDVILGIDGSRIDSFSQMVRIVRQHEGGDIIVAQLNRYGHLMEVQIRLESH